MEEVGVRPIHIVVGLVLVVASLGIVRAEQAVKDSEMGLSRTSVFEAPAPEPFSYGKAFPGSGNTLPRAFPGAPPQIPHDIGMFTPVTAAKNACVACHDKPAMMGQKTAGAPTPMPASHYTDLRRAPGTVTGKLIGARFVCTQCHVPQADVKPLVDNTF
jgi:cytochrome c-type protein NapB